MSNHTSGPWTVEADGGGWYIECTPEREHAIACIASSRVEDDPDTSDEEKEANARLIAAAPDLLAALHKLSANAAESPEWIRSVASEAIAKAEGRA